MSCFISSVRDVLPLQSADTFVEAVLDFVRGNLATTKTLAAVTASVITYKIVAFYWRRRWYPPGPLPWPIVGNIMSTFTSQRRDSTAFSFSDFETKTNTFSM